MPFRLDYGTISCFAESLKFLCEVLAVFTASGYEFDETQESFNNLWTKLMLGATGSLLSSICIDT